MKVDRKAAVLQGIAWMAAAVFMGTYLFADLLRAGQSDASVSDLPHPMSLVKASDEFNRPLLKGLRVDPANPLKLSFIIDTEDTAKLSRREVTKIINYFLAAVSIPRRQLWVNLSPYEEDRIIEENLGRTELGEGFLKQDYILKQLSSSLTHPETSVGREYWKSLNSAAGAESDAFNKIWIVPGKAEVFEKDNTVVVNDATLMVMTETDYLALERNSSSVSGALRMTDESAGGSSSAVKEFIIPEVEQDVNYGRNFTQLRQIYYSLILATWFKGKVKDAVLASYADSGKVAGIDYAPEDIEKKVFELYGESFQKGVYSLIKKEETGDSKRTHYFSGGIRIDEDFKTDSAVEFTNSSFGVNSRGHDNPLYEVNIGIAASAVDNRALESQMDSAADQYGADLLQAPFGVIDGGLQSQIIQNQIVISYNDADLEAGPAAAFEFDSGDDTGNAVEILEVREVPGADEEMEITDTDLQTVDTEHDMNPQRQRMLDFFTATHEYVDGIQNDLVPLVPELDYERLRVEINNLTEAYNNLSQFARIIDNVDRKRQAQEYVTEEEQQKAQLARDLFDALDIVHGDPVKRHKLFVDEIDRIIAIRSYMLDKADETMPHIYTRSDGIQLSKYYTQGAIAAFFFDQPVESPKDYAVQQGVIRDLLDTSEYSDFNERQDILQLIRMRTLQLQDIRQKQIAGSNYDIWRNESGNDSILEELKVLENDIDLEARNKRQRISARQRSESYHSPDVNYYENSLSGELSKMSQRNAGPPQDFPDALAEYRNIQERLRVLSEVSENMNKENAAVLRKGFDHLSRQMEAQYPLLSPQRYYGRLEQINETAQSDAQALEMLKAGVDEIIDGLDDVRVDPVLYGRSRKVLTTYVQAIERRTSERVEARRRMIAQEQAEKAREKAETEAALEARDNMRLAPYLKSINMTYAALESGSGEVIGLLQSSIPEQIGMLNDALSQAADPSDVKGFREISMGLGRLQGLTQMIADVNRDIEILSDEAEQLTRSGNPLMVFEAVDMMKENITDIRNRLDTYVPSPGRPELIGRHQRNLLDQLETGITSLRVQAVSNTVSEFKNDFSIGQMALQDSTVNAGVYKELKEQTIDKLNKTDALMELIDYKAPLEKVKAGYEELIDKFEKAAAAGSHRDFTGPAVDQTQQDVYLSEYRKSVLDLRSKLDTGRLPDSAVFIDAIGELDRLQADIRTASEWGAAGNNSLAFAAFENTQDEISALASETAYRIITDYGSQIEALNSEFIRDKTSYADVKNSALGSIDVIDRFISDLDMINEDNNQAIGVNKRYMIDNLELQKEEFALIAKRALNYEMLELAEPESEFMSVPESTQAFNQLYDVSNFSPEDRMRVNIFNEAIDEIAQQLGDLYADRKSDDLFDVSGGLNQQIQRLNARLNMERIRAGHADNQAMLGVLPELESRLGRLNSRLDELVDMRTGEVAPMLLQNITAPSFNDRQELAKQQQQQVMLLRQKEMIQERYLGDSWDKLTEPAVYRMLDKVYRPRRSFYNEAVKPFIDKDSWTTGDVRFLEDLVARMNIDRSELYRMRQAFNPHAYKLDTANRTLDNEILQLEQTLAKAKKALRWTEPSLAPVLDIYESDQATADRIDKIIDGFDTLPAIGQQGYKTGEPELIYPVENNVYSFEAALEQLPDIRDQEWRKESKFVLPRIRQRSEFVDRDDLAPDSIQPDFTDNVYSMRPPENPFENRPSVQQSRFRSLKDAAVVRAAGAAGIAAVVAAKALEFFSGSSSALNNKSPETGGIDLGDINITGQEGSSSITLAPIDRIDIVRLSFDILSIEELNTETFLASLK